MLKNKKILLIGLYYFENLGDPLYMLTTKKLIEQHCDAVVEIADIHPIKKRNPIKKHINKIKNIFRKILHLKQPDIDFVKQYKKIFQGYDAVVVPGGGVISLKDYPFHKYFKAMQEACDELNIKFCMNAVGITKIFGEELKNTDEWQKIIDSKSMTYFTCRDGQDILQNICKKEIKKSPCTATLSAKLFDIKRNENSNTIGIGVIKGDVFSESGFDYNEEQLVDLYSNLVSKIKALGYKVNLFVNGFKTDYNLAIKVQNRLNDDTLLLKQAKTPEELVYQISQFKAVVCARMHAAIIAFSLDIPTVLFCWGVKGIEFMKEAGAEEFALTYEKMQADYVVEMLQKSIKQGWNEEKRLLVQQSVEDNIEELLKIIDN